MENEKPNPPLYRGDYDLRKTSLFFNGTCWISLEDLEELERQEQSRDLGIFGAQTSRDREFEDIDYDLY